jgi:hypothetical protein
MSVPESFTRALAELWVRDRIDVDEPLALAGDVVTLFANGGDDARAATALLTRSGVRAQWNDRLRRDRARALAARIQPLVAEPMLDVLAGDGSVCDALRALGVGALTATERTGDYAAYGASWPAQVPFTPFSDSMDLSQFNASTALISTVLHHENDPRRLLDALARAPIARWIVVENCVTAEYSRAFHEFADRFFNTCLNEIGIHCGEEHRTLDDWSRQLELYGAVTVVADSFPVPGIPFPYSLLVVQRQ